MATRTPSWFRSGRSLVGFTIIMVGFGLFFTLMAMYFLLPATQAAAASPTTEKKRLLAMMALMLVLVLLSLAAMASLVMAFAGMLKTRNKNRREKTRYVDAWGEAGKRMPLPPEDDRELRE
jgi:heme/copper-type cytochrome/quinol oxidase subunit 3